MPKLGVVWPPVQRVKLDMKPLLTGKLPKVPDRLDYLMQMDGGWKMLGNGPDDTVFPGFQGAGVCNAVRKVNTSRVWSKFLGSGEVYGDWADVLALYRTQNPDFDPHGTADTNGPDSSADGGMDTGKLCDYLHKTGELAFYGTVDHNDEEAVDAMAALFGTIWTDVAVQDAQQQQFGANEPWDWIKGSQLDGYHAIVSGGYGPDSAGSLDAITWAREIALTDRYRTYGIQTITVPVSPLHLGTKAFLEGIDQEALAQAYQAATGSPFQNGS